MTQVMRLCLYTAASLVVFTSCVAALARYESVFPWLVVLVVLGIVGRMVWARTRL